MKNIDLDRLKVVNEVLLLIMPEVTVWLSIKNNALHITAGYRSKNNKPIKERRVKLRSGSDYFFSSNSWFPSGGTHERATVELVRWIREKPENDIRLWRHWCSPSVGMKPNSIIQILLEAGYPERSTKGYWSQ